MIQKMINFYGVTKEDTKEHNSSCPQIPDFPYRILIVGASGLQKTNSLFNLIIHQLDIDETCLYATDSQLQSITN